MSKPSLIRESLATIRIHPRNMVCTHCIHVNSQRTEASKKHLTFMYVINNPSKAMGMPKPVVIQFLTLSFIPKCFHKGSHYLFISNAEPTKRNVEAGTNIQLELVGSIAFERTCPERSKDTTPDTFFTLRLLIAQ